MSKHRRPIGRRTFLSGLAATATSCAIANRPQPLNDNVQAKRDRKSDFAVVGDTPLRDRAAAKGLLYGAATGSQILSSDSAFAENLVKECAMLVPENALKFGSLRPSPTRFDFAEADALVEFSRTHNMLVRGHTLIWGQDFSDWGPEWLRKTLNSQNAEQVLVNHVQRVVKHYAGKIHSWDVVNEAITPSHGRADRLAKTRWLELIGPDYIDIAFRAAAEADPKAMLVFNDCEFEFDTEDGEQRRVAVLKLLERLKSQGTPVHALGIESHMPGVLNQVNRTKLKAFLRNVADIGLKIMITELDVIDRMLPADIPVRDRLVAQVYEDYLSSVLEEPAVIAVVTWGLSDRYTWHSRFNAREDKRPVRSLPLDDQFKRKLAWNAIARAFDKAPKR